MKKFTLLFILVTVLALNSFAQNYFGYSMNNRWGDYEELIDGIQSTATGDDSTDILTLPFQFKFCNYFFTTIKISTNGWLQFGATYDGPGNLNDLTDPQYNNFVCPLWDDFFADDETEISYKVEGTYPARYFKIQWKNIRLKHSVHRINFQVWLVEFDNSILFMYGPSTGEAGISASIGITNNTGGINNFISVNVVNSFLQPIQISDSISYNIPLLNMMAEDNFITAYSEDQTVKLYQIPETLTPGAENQVIFSILYYGHQTEFDQIEIKNLRFNILGTTDSSDILKAKLYRTFWSGTFSTLFPLGSIVENPGRQFVIGDLPGGTLFPWIYVNYLWLVFDIAPGAQTNNIIDAACTLIETEGLYASIVPDSSLASGHHVIGTPIPVELTAFTASVKENDVYLNWSTGTEVNNKGFELQRTEVGSQSIFNSEWSIVGFVEGNGTTTEPREYSFVDEDVESGKYKYKFVQIDYDGTRSEERIIEVEVNAVPQQFALMQNFPNPFNPSTKIKYALSSKQHVQLKIYDILGNEIADLINEIKQPGEYEITLDASKFSSGVYLYRLTAGQFTSTKKMQLMK